MLDAPDVRARLAELGIAASPSTPAEIAGQVASEREKWSRVIKASGARLE